MQKLSDKSFSEKVKPFFAICMVMLLYVWSISTIVTGENGKTNDENSCNTEMQQELFDALSGDEQGKAIVCNESLIRFQEFREKVPDLKLPPGFQNPYLFLRPTVSASPVESTESQQPEESQIIEEIPLPKVSLLDNRLPALVYLRIDSDNPTGPLLLSDERVSEDDIEIDISNAIDSDLYYTVPYDLEQCIARVVYRESGNQPVFGQLQVAEGVVTRLRSGIYGSDVSAILYKGYYVETDENGYHVYNGNGVEVIDVPEVATTVTKLALQGSNTTEIVLEAGTALRNEQFGLELGEDYYKWGAFYHYSPNDIGPKEQANRVIGQVPVSYRYVDHVFYGKWLNAKYALNIE